MVFLPTPAAVPALATKVPDDSPQHGDYGHPSIEPEPAPNHPTAGGNVYGLRTEPTTL